jgi:hypothetical protein
MTKKGMEMQTIEINEHQILSKYGDSYQFREKLIHSTIDRYLKISEEVLLSMARYAVDPEWAGRLPLDTAEWVVSWDHETFTGCGIKEPDPAAPERLFEVWDESNLDDPLLLFSVCITLKNASDITLFVNRNSKSRRGNPRRLTARAPWSEAKWT